MKYRSCIVSALTVLFFVFVSTSCDRNSSPEGRMSTKIEELHKGMTDSLQKQNKAILDSLGSIRQELKELREQIR
jgi:prephenate dehydrogenase